MNTYVITHRNVTDSTCPPVASTRPLAAQNTFDWWMEVVEPVAVVAVALNASVIL